MRKPAATLRDRRGTATIEFALASLFLFGVITVALDFGMYVQQKLKLGSVVEQAGIIAFNAGSNTPDETVLTSFIQNAGANSDFRCNSATQQACTSTTTSQCIGAPATAGGWPTFTAPSSGACASGGSPGYYLVIRATKTYQAMVVSDKYLGGKYIVQQTVVRLS